jgi:hypothetical protein
VITGTNFALSFRAIALGRVASFKDDELRFLAYGLPVTLVLR